MKKIFLTAIVLLALSAPVFVSAQGLKDAGKFLDKVADPSKTGLSKDLPTAIAAVIKTILALVGTIFLILTIYAGILWMTAAGEEDKVTKAKDIIRASIIGLVVIMSAYAITYFVTSRLGAAAGTGNSASTLGCCQNVPIANGCASDVTESSCDTASNNLVWNAGSCPANCP